MIFLKHKLIYTILLCMISSASFSQVPDDYYENLDDLIKQSIPLIKADELKSILMEYRDIVILDSREKGEYKTSHIEKARFIGYSNFNISVCKDIPKDAEIVVYCSLGVRSEKVAEMLKAAGYTNVRNLYGGIFDWVHHDYSIVDNKGKPTLKVHTYDEDWSGWLYKGEKVY